ncbi:MAG TPA: hypothetical protein VFZ68_15615 [Acidimicrobiales bacterium]
MNKPKTKQNRRRRAKKQRPVDLWRPVAPLPPPEPIAPADDPTALLRSLGTPPLHPRGAVAEHYMATVVERAAALATAVAASADLLAPPEDEQAGDEGVEREAAPAA